MSAGRFGQAATNAEALSLPTVCLLARIEPGHHQSFVDLFTHIFSDRGIGVRLTDRPATALSHSGPLFVLMVEQYPLLTYVLAAVRALLGRRTAGLVFRSKEALAGTSPRLRVKRALLRLVRRSERVAMLTIIPHALLPGADAITRGWIDDPQLWDLSVLPHPARPTAIGARVREAARGRPVILCAGQLGPDKGLDALVALASDAGFTSDYCLVLAGPIRDAGDVAAIRSCDCIIEDRYLEDDELLSLYDVASFVWAAYAPQYNQASGVFARAVQLGRVPIVRRGSLIDDYAGRLGAARAAIDWPVDPAQVRDAIAAIGTQPAPHEAARSQANIATVIEALFGAGP